MAYEEDKVKHFAGSFAIAGASSGIARYYGSSYIESVAIGIATSVLVGIAKERIDGNGHGSEDINDVYADTLGGAVGSVIGASFNWRF